MYILYRYILGCEGPLRPGYNQKEYFFCHHPLNDPKGGGWKMKVTITFSKIYIYIP